MTDYALLFTLAAIGISEAVYLVRKRIALEKPVCLLGEKCEVVLESKYNQLFIIHNDLLGVLFYIVVCIIATFLVIGVEPIFWWDISLKVLVGLGSLMSLIFTFIQWRVVKAWCFWCLMSAFTIWFMGIILLVTSY